MAVDTTAKPDSRTIERLNLLMRLAYEPEACRRHFLVYQFLLDWWMSGRGDALASCDTIAAELKRRDPAGIGMSRSKVAAPISDLIKWGYLERLPGTGTGKKNASRYVPNWALVTKTVSTVGNKYHFTPCDAPLSQGGKLTLTVPDSGDTTVPTYGDISAATAPAYGGKDLLTSTRQQPRTMVGSDDSPAPAEASLSLAAGGDEDFEKLWIAYGVRRDRAKARAAFAKISESPDIVIAAANAWREAWQPGKVERKHLSTWLSEERYFEEPPAPARSTAQKTKPVAVQPTIAAMPVAKSVTVATAVFGVDGYLRLAGTEGDAISIAADTPDFHESQRGQLRLAKLATACGMARINDPAELVGKRFVLVGDEDFRPAPENDNVNMGVAA